MSGYLDRDAQILATAIDQVRAAATVQLRGVRRQRVSGGDEARHALAEIAPASYVAPNVGVKRPGLSRRR